MKNKRKFRHCKLQNQIILRMNFIYIKVGVLILLLIQLGCKPEPEPQVNAAYEQGVFVTNEGVFSQTSGTITYYNEDSLILKQGIFKRENSRDLGNVVQSMCFHEDKAYVVVNNSNKIEVADANSFKEVAQILNLEQPRYFLPISATKAYVSQWGNDLLSGSIAVVNLTTNTIEQRIESGIGKGPERMLLYGDKVFVVHTGGLETDNLLAVIDTNSHSVVQSIALPDVPNSLQLAADGNIWLACRGKTVYSNYPQIDTQASTAGAIVAINPQSYQEEYQLGFAKGEGASDLIRNALGNQLFYSHQSQVWQLDPLSRTPSVLLTGNFYGLGFADGRIYAAEYAGIQPAWIYRYSASTGIKIDSFQAGVFANGFYFK